MIYLIEPLAWVVAIGTPTLIAVTLWRRARSFNRHWNTTPREDTDGNT